MTPDLFVKIFFVLLLKIIPPERAFQIYRMCLDETAYGAGLVFGKYLAVILTNRIYYMYTGLLFKEKSLGVPIERCYLIFVPSIGV